MLTVCCVLRTKHSPAGIYDAFHVFRLQLAVSRHLRAPYRFVCLSDTALDCETIPLIKEWPGFWSKIELFRPGLFNGRVLYLDLDVTVVGDLSELAVYGPTFAAIADYQFPLKLNSSVMAWNSWSHTDIFSALTSHDMERLRGDQDWIFERVPNFNRFPRLWCPSYKAHVRPTGQLHKDARVIVWHGRPKPWDVPRTEFLGEKVA